MGQGPIECQIKVERIKNIITSPANSTNIVDAYCMLLNVHTNRKVEPKEEPKKYEKDI